MYYLRRNLYQFTHVCLPRRTWLVVVMTFSVLITLGLLILDQAAARLRHEETMAETIAVLKTRLNFLDSQNRGKQEALLDVQMNVDNGCKSQTDVDDEPITLSPELEVLIKNMSGRVSESLLSKHKPEPIKVPFSLRIMPHLLDHPDSLRPAFQLRSARSYSDYIIGVPHVKRDKETYLFETIKFLLDKMTDEDKKYTMIVVLIGETDMTYVVETAHNIEKKFGAAVEAGLIEVISPSQHYYPDLDAMTATLGDSFKRFKWRTKQNLDAIFLMAFAHSRCLYYLMVEDDVLALDNYMTEIRIFTTSTIVSNPGWFFIQYSTTGGIGKLFRSTDLIHFLTYVQLFYSNMPIDWLTESYLADRACGINKGAKECADAKNKIRPTYKKNLFKHIGLYSSLKGKIQKVKPLDRIISRYAKKPMIRGWWKLASKMKYNAHEVAPIRENYVHIGMGSPVTPFEFFPHTNPPVSSIKCGLVPFEDHTIDAAYNGVQFFWGKEPKAGDVIEFWFQNPSKFDRYLIRSGNVKHAKDIIAHAVFEILPTTHKNNGSFVKIDDFDEFGMVEGRVDSDRYGELLAIRIRFEEKSKFWVSITEIEFVPLENPASVVSKTQSDNITRNSSVIAGE